MKRKYIFVPLLCICSLLGIVILTIFLNPLFVSLNKPKTPEFKSYPKETIVETTEPQSTVNEITTENPTEKAIATTAETLTEPPTEKSAQYSTTESVLFEKNGIKIIYKGIGTAWLGNTVKLRIENTSNTNYCVQARDVSVNGYMVDPIFSCDVSSGKIANDHISFSETEFKENDITTINEIELSFHIFNNDNWSDYFDTEKITIRP